MIPNATTSTSKQHIDRANGGKAFVPYWEASLTAISQTSLDGVMIVDHLGTVRGWNHNAADIFGWTEQEAIGRYVVDLVVSPSLRSEFIDRFMMIGESSGSSLLNRRYEREAQRKDGSAVPLEIGIMPTGPKPERMYVVFVRDLTEQRRVQAQMASRTHELEETQHQLRESEQLYRHVIELSNMVPWVSDAAGNTISLGARWELWTGQTIESALGMGWVASLHPNDCDQLISAWNNTVDTGLRYDNELRILHADGNYRWCRARAEKVIDPSTGETTWYGTLDDIHERKTAAESLQRAQTELTHVARLGAMGAMGSAIAHDLNQPLTAVTHYIRGCKMLLRSIDGPNMPEVREGLEDADRAALRAGDIVRRVREFVARGHVETQRESIVDLVEESCKLGLIDAAFRGIAWRAEFGVTCHVIADRVQVQQVLVNLLRNAVEAMNGQPDRRLIVRTRHGPPGFCEISVSDTGRGLSSESAAKIFDPFYTTRTNGTGIGLSISRMIVEAHGGTIWHSPDDGIGTTMKFTLPLDKTGTNLNHEETVAVSVAS